MTKKMKDHLSASTNRSCLVIPMSVSPLKRTRYRLCYPCREFLEHEKFQQNRVAFSALHPRIGLSAQNNQGDVSTVAPIFSSSPSSFVAGLSLLPPLLAD